MADKHGERRPEDVGVTYPDAEFVGDVGRQVQHGTPPHFRCLGLRARRCGRVGRGVDEPRQLLVGVGGFSLALGGGGLGVSDGFERFARVDACEQRAEVVGLFGVARVGQGQRERGRQEARREDVSLG